MIEQHQTQRLQAPLTSPAWVTHLGNAKSCHRRYQSAISAKRRGGDAAQDRPASAGARRDGNDDLESHADVEKPWHRSCASPEYPAGPALRRHHRPRTPRRPSSKVERQPTLATALVDVRLFRPRRRMTERGRHDVRRKCPGSPTPLGARDTSRLGSLRFKWLGEARPTKAWPNPKTLSHQQTPSVPRRSDPTKDT